MKALQSKQKMCSLMLATISCLLSILLRQIAAEEQSLLTNAEVYDLYQHTGWTGNKNSVISAGFKSFIMLNNNPNGDHSGEI